MLGALLLLGSLLCLTLVIILLLIVKMYRGLRTLPIELFTPLKESILGSIRGDLSKNKGSIGELAALTRLMAEYDNLVPDGRIGDFIGIKLPDDTTSGSLDFIEVKSGTGKITKFQESIRQIIEQGNVRYIEVRVQVERQNDTNRKITKSRKTS